MRQYKGFRKNSRGPENYTSKEKNVAGAKKIGRGRTPYVEYPGLSPNS
jgi:hypothetical protein